MSYESAIKRLGLEHLKHNPAALKAAAQKILEETAPKKGATRLRGSLKNLAK